jgi:hypothetical protein
MWDPVIWRTYGQVTELVTPHGLDALPRAIKNDGSVSGAIVWGNDPRTAHVEAAYWPNPTVNVGLGVLPRGGWSDAFGMDEGGWLTGAMDRFVHPKRNPFDEDGVIHHSFLWAADMGPGKVRIMPSLYGLRHDLPLRNWAGSAMHAVNRRLNQVGSASHWKYRGDRLIYAPTVYLNADQCGLVRRTTHRLDGADAPVAARQKAPHAWRTYHFSPLEDARR